MNMTSCSVSCTRNLNDALASVVRGVVAARRSTGRCLRSSNRALHSAEFTIREDRVVTLNPELARAIGRYVSY